MENDPRRDPILKLLVVDAARQTSVWTTSAVVTFARATKNGRPCDPLEEQSGKLAVPLEHTSADELRTDDDGVATIDLGVMRRIQQMSHPRLPPHWTEGWPVRVEVRAHGYLPAKTDWFRAPMQVKDEPHRIELSSAPIVGGRVVDESGAPMAGVELDLVRRIPGDKDPRKPCRCSCFGVPYRDDNEVHSRATTGATGVFSLPYTEDSTFRIRARASGRAPGVTEPFAVQLPISPSPRELVMTVLDCGIEGAVRAFDGEPTARALVVFCRADGFAQPVTTDAEGRYRLPLPPGRYRVNRGDPTAARWKAIVSDHLGFRLWHGPGDAPAADPAQFTVEVRAGGFATWDLDARRPHDALLIVHVEAEGEDPATFPVYLSRAPADWAVELAWPRRVEFDVVGDAPALFPELPPGRYQVRVGLDEVEVELLAGEHTELEVELSTATVAGRLLDADGAGVVARLELDEPPEPPPMPNQSKWKSEGKYEIESETEASFHFCLVRPGECRLRVYVERDGSEVLVHDAPLSLLSKGLHEPIIQVERPV